jgi:hypothetical protein
MFRREPDKFHSNADARQAVTNLTARVYFDSGPAKPWIKTRLAPDSQMSRAQAANRE